jgi:hypothetical protein
MLAAIMMFGQKLIPVHDDNAQPAYELISGDETYRLASVHGVGYRLQRHKDQWERMFPSLEGAVAYVNALERTAERRAIRRQRDRADDGDVRHA